MTDKEAPTITGVTNNSTYTTSVTPTITDTKSGIYSYKLTKDGNEISWTNKNAISERGSYVLTAKCELIISNIENTSNYKIIKDKYITNIPIGTMVEDFNLRLENIYTTRIFDRFDVIKTSGRLATGDKVKIYLQDELVVEYIVVIKGDVRGTGTPTVSDVAKLYQYLRGKITMEEYFILAGNTVDTDQEIRVNDVAKLYQFIREKIESLEN